MLSVALVSCSKVKDKVHETVNKGGQVVGEGASEFASGVRRGVQNVFDIKVELSKPLQDKGLTLGRTTVESDSAATDNVLSAHISFKQDFNGTVTARAYDRNAREMGIAHLPINMKSGDGTYFAFHFPHETDIDNDSRLVIE
jgi:hypothetical protein